MRNKELVCLFPIIHVLLKRQASSHLRALSLKGLLDKTPNATEGQ